MDRLDTARDWLEKAWSYRPDDPRTAQLMLRILLDSPSTRDEYDLWFARAMAAGGGDGDGTLEHRDACASRLFHLEPRWGGELHDVVAFRKACRATGNWRSGITLLVAQAHQEVADNLPLFAERDYLMHPEVWGEIRDVYEEYLSHFPQAHVTRCEYAYYCFKAKDYVACLKQFEILGDNLYETNRLNIKELKLYRDLATINLR